MGNFFSYNKKSFFDEFVKIDINNNSVYIYAITKLNNNNPSINEIEFEKLKNNTIEKINKINENFKNSWIKYDLKFFYSQPVDHLQALIYLKKDMAHQYTHQICKLYNNLINKLILEHEIDNKIYKN